MKYTPEEIYRIRYQLRLTQAELAAKLGVKTDTIRSWEAGRREPGAPALKLLRNMISESGERKPSIETSALLQAIVWVAEDIEAQLAKLSERIRKLEKQ